MLLVHATTLGGFDEEEPSEEGLLLLRRFVERVDQGTELLVGDWLATYCEPGLFAGFAVAVSVVLPLAGGTVPAARFLLTFTATRAEFLSGCHMAIIP